MPNLSEQKNNFYALLIGIDGYIPNPMYKNLKGCVRDINLVGDYFLKTLKISSEQIVKLISPNPDISDLSITPDLLPTCENIVGKFHAITELAQAGEQVCIYYSGHGGRATTIYPELKDTDQLDEGIVPMDIGDEDGRYLRDVELATLLKRMTDKGLIVTVILDSCHSGGATRGDAAIRGGEGIDTVSRSAESLGFDRQELINNWKALTSENYSGVSWVPQTKNYVLLAACRPNEFAYEYAVNGTERHGALTYWLMDTLATRNTGISFSALYHRICAQIQSKFPQQLPMLLGDGNRSVFGSDRILTPYSVNVMSVNGNQITLDAGLAQGLSLGTRFAIYPLSTTDFSNPQQQIALVELEDIQASQSIAKVLLPETGGFQIRGNIEPGCPTILVSAPVELVRRVRLFNQKQAGILENELPPELANKQTEALEIVRQALIGNGWVLEVQPENHQEADYQVAVGRNGEYEICSGTPLKNLGLPLKINDPNGGTTVVKRLVHLAKYQAIQSLDNSNSKLEQKIEMELLDGNKQPFANPDQIILKEGESACLRVKNNSGQPLNIVILDLEPTWAISQIPINGSEDVFYPLENQEDIEIDLEPGLPNGLNYKQVNETLKLFATRGLANFQWLTLPALDQDLGSKGDLNVLLDEKLATKGEGNINPMNELFSTIGADVDHPPLISRSMRYKPDPNAEWLTKEVRFTITQNL
ncbi:MAG: caspase [Oscillatoriales cyanobacterium CG2_30_40_61]|nr:MAG: caspase [Oscillatoriales cyanobacterium CG2_30_40_61]